MRTSDPFKEKFVVALTALHDARRLNTAESTHYMAVKLLIFDQILSALDTLLNGNPTLKKSKSLSNGWRIPDDAVKKDIPYIPIPDIMTREISRMVIVIMEYLLGHEGAGEPKSTWCAMGRFLELWRDITMDEKMKSYAICLVHYMFLKNDVKKRISGIIPACTFAMNPGIKKSHTAEDPVADSVADPVERNRIRRLFKLDHVETQNQADQQASETDLVADPIIVWPAEELMSPATRPDLPFAGTHEDNVELLTPDPVIPPDSRFRSPEGGPAYGPHIRTRETSPNDDGYCAPNDDGYCEAFGSGIEIDLEFLECEPGEVIRTAPALGLLTSTPTMNFVGIGIEY